MTISSVSPPPEAKPSTRVRKPAASGDRRERVVLRLHPDVRERVAYWAQKRNLSVNEYIAEAVDEQIRRENLDYDLPTLEIARLNQLVDEMKANSVNLANLERVVTKGFDSLIGLTRGDNYLLDDEDGEL